MQPIEKEFWTRGDICGIILIEENSVVSSANRCGGACVWAINGMMLWRSVCMSNKWNGVVEERVYE